MLACERLMKHILFMYTIWAKLLKSQVLSNLTFVVPINKVDGLDVAVVSFNKIDGIKNSSYKTEVFLHICYFTK